MESKFVNLSDNSLADNFRDPTWWKGTLDLDHFDIIEKVAWMRRYWTYSVYASLIYLICIYLGQEYMRHRKAFNLKIPLAIWNGSLALFSIYACTVIFPEFLRIIRERGVHLSICGTIEVVSKPSLYWGYLFVLSKMVELGDTAFIILRKRKLIFLHWYHHISVLVCVWVSSKNLMSTGAWFAMVNFMVHAMMYTYFTLTTLGVKVPQVMSMALTTLQVNQMVVGLGVNVYALQAKLTGTECHVTDFHIWLVFGMYFSYLVLFGNFFYKTYISKERKRKIE